MVDIQSPTAEIRREKKKKPQDENIYGGHKLAETIVNSLEIIADSTRREKLNQETRIQAIEIVSEALCGIIFGQRCMFSIWLRRKM